LTPFYKNNKEEEMKENEIHKMQTTKAKQQPKLNKWTQRKELKHEKRSQQKQPDIIIDSGATSHFISKELNLPKMGQS
jgi:hypothetical protein